MEQADRRKLLKAIGAASAAGFAGCLGGDDEGDGEDDEAAEDEGGVTEITYRDRSGAGDLTVYPEAFNESQDEIEVIDSLQPVEESYRALISQISAGDAPETIGLDVVYLPRFVELGGLKELDDFYEELDYTDEFFDPLEDFVFWDDTVYGLPFWIDCSLYIYNKNHYEDAGLDPEAPPETFDEFLDACETLQGAGYDTPLSNTLSFTGLESFFYLPHVWAGGGGLFNDDMTECIVDEEPGVEAAEFFLELEEEGYSTDQTSTEAFTYPAFYSEETSMAYSGGTGLGVVRENNEELYENMGVAAFPHPEGGESSSFLGGNSITISAQTEGEEFEASKEFLEWLNSEEGMRLTVEELGYVPARPSGLETDFVEERSELYEPFLTALEQGNTPMHPDFLEMQEPLNNALERIILGDQDPQPALTEAADQITQILQG